jgi:predicted Zn finger-like uncharacterized protein
MFTLCPKCTLTLAVTAGDLRAGQGYVRCGRCSNVFNALLQLTEEPVELHASPAASPPARAPAPPATVGAAAALRPTATAAAATAAAPRRPAIPPTPAGDGTAAAGPAPALPPAAAAVAGTAARTSAPRAAPAPAAAPPRPAATLRSARGGAAPAARSPTPQEDATDEFHIDDIDFPDTTGTFESILLEGDAITRTEGVIPAAATPPPPRASARRASDAAAKAFVARSRSAAPTSPAELPATPSMDGVAEAPPSEESPGEEALSDEAAQAKAIAAVLQPSPQRGAWLWIGLCVLLAVLLLVQMVDHWRNALASSPLWSAPLASIYGGLGVPLSPHWDLSAYDVRQQGAQGDAADPRIIRVRLSVANHAARAQPVPLLRLTLLDRYGRPIAARDLTPAEYWPHGRPLEHFLGSDQRIDSEVAVRTATSDSASFEIDVCLRDGHGSVHCASDTNGVAATEAARVSSGA